MFPPETHHHSSSPVPPPLFPLQDKLTDGRQEVKVQRWLMDTVYSSALTECEEGRDGWPSTPLPAQKGKCTIKIRAINILQWRQLMDMKKPSLAAAAL